MLLMLLLLLRDEDTSCPTCAGEAARDQCPVEEAADVMLREDAREEPRESPT
eukprot:CAMPEP_0185752130 /NCGR_PEP_ID=MMETSP1174-20130828/10929_1 /TAXON_ID=35687 /ORGANISM="Dictyocha speculum, Strain CCMP1381" /LENGTH=51 /DNA_ID=CAMNT_0028429433 /DNA_START=42 /DNA_END=193 /DNA_ORIENTATION=-